jgi:hypothetical protein
MADMTMEPVENSHAISAMGYDQASGTLRVTFASGGTYEYDDVTPQDYADFKNAESKGRHHAQNIRGKFSHRRV